MAQPTKYTITLPDHISDVLEEQRGDVPRSIFIRRAIEEKLGLPHGPIAPPGPVRSSDVQGAIKPDTKGLQRRTRRTRNI